MSNGRRYKVADWQVAPGRYNATQCFKASTEPKHNDCRFTHPFVQVYAMFLGEALCLGAFFALRAAKKVQYKPFNWLVFWPCAVCDMCGTSLMLLGLLLTFMSNFQMLRGSVVLFTGIFSRIFLGRRLSWANWGGMLLVLFGTAIVGLDALIHPQHTATASNPFLGNILIILAQIIVAVQVCGARTSDGLVARALAASSMHPPRPNPPLVSQRSTAHR
jgi:drug/metabolite transporter (DMT)-like permease